MRIAGPDCDLVTDVTGGERVRRRGPSDRRSPGLSREEELALIRDRTPAHERGVTILQACAIYGKPYREVRQVYLGPPSGVARRDHWDVYFADHADLQERLGEGKAQREAASGLSASQQARKDRIAALRSRVQGGGL